MEAGIQVPGTAPHRITHFLVKWIPASMLGRQKFQEPLLLRLLMGRSILGQNADDNRILAGLVISSLLTEAD